VTEPGCALDSTCLSHFLRRTGIQPGSSPGQAFGGKCSRRIVLLTIAAAAFGLSVATAAHAQTYPDRLIRMVVPFPPGGPVDVTARIVAQRLPAILGQTVIVENRAGASGVIGARSVASADPDGYTLMFGNLSTLAVLPAVIRDYDPERMFAAVAKVTENYEVLVVQPSFFAQSVQELVAYAKANPGKLNYGSAGPGNATHLAAELFRLRTGIDIVHVPYRGAADAVTGVLGGQVQLFFGDTGGVLPLLQEGRLRALAVSSATRNPPGSGRADHDGERRARLRGCDLHRRGGAGRDGARHHRQAQRRHQRKPEVGGRARRAQAHRRGGTARVARGIRHPSGGRAREMARGGETVGHQGRVRQQTGARR